jgi:hypothetical protein
MSEQYSALQNIHDNFPVEEWSGELRDFAEELGLEVPA